MRPMQVTITLDGRESELLRKAATRELRRPKDQARHLLRLALAEYPVLEMQNDAGSVRQDQVASVVL